MTQKFYKTEEAAKVLGVSPAEVTKMRESHKLHGYRDGMDWKFKTEDVDQVAGQLQAEDASEGPDDESTDVLLSEAELGQPESGASAGTVIGASEAEGSPADSDIQLGDSDVKLSGSEQPAEEGGSGDELGELDLTLEEDLTLDDSQVSLSEDKEEKAAEDAVKTGGSDLDLAQDEGLDDDLVLSGSGSGSDITMGGDSGISLVDPADSGLSLEEPLELAGAADETLELGEDDMISLSEEADLDSPTELKAEEEFTLTPMEEIGEEDDSESGSQVIALDDVDEGEAAVGALAGGRAPMLDEDFAAEPILGMEGVEMGSPLGAGPMGAPQDLAAGQPLGAQVAALPEAPYTVWNIVSLVFCAIFLALAGMMMYDLVRNMWSWDKPGAVTSPLMEWILGLFEK